MRGLLLILGCLLCAQTAAAIEPAALLFSDNTALVAPDAPDVLIEHLVLQQNALIYLLDGADYRASADVRAAIVPLPELPADRQAAADSVAEWVKRYRISLVIMPEHPAAARLWRQSLEGLCDLYAHVAEFKPGDIALPHGSEYDIYRGPNPVFFDPGPSAMGAVINRYLDNDTALSAGEKRLAVKAGTLRLVAEENSAFGEPVMRALATAIQTTDSLSAESGPAATTARTYAVRWRSILSQKLNPHIGTAEFGGLAGVTGEGRLTLESHAPVEIRIDSVSVGSSSVQIGWTTPLPGEISPGGRFELAGRLLAHDAAVHHIPMHINYSFADLQLRCPVTITTEMVASIAVEFDPPIAYASSANERPDPDYRIKMIPVTARITNRTTARRQIKLEWFADDPVSVSVSLREVTLKSGEVRTIPITLSLPTDWKGKALSYGVKVNEAKSTVAQGIGRLWQSRADIDGKPQVAVLGDAGIWLTALNAVGVTGFPLDINHLADADMSPFRAVIISGDIAPPSPAAMQKIRDLARRGRRIIVDLTPPSAAWLPWPTKLERRGAPTSAKYFKKDLNWWAKPNTLLGDCFAAVTSGEVFTLPPGIQEWEPLVTDASGKGFMYRRAEGKGWYVVVHKGWREGIRRMERRPMMGLVNLVGRSIR